MYELNQTGLVLYQHCTWLYIMSGNQPKNKLSVEGPVRGSVAFPYAKHSQLELITFVIDGI